jgi:hypothetical protein
LWAGQAGDRVRGDSAPAAAAGLSGTTDDLDGLGGVGEAQPGDGGDLQGPDLDAAVAMIAVRSMTGICRHGNPTSWACRVGWLALTTNR